MFTGEPFVDRIITAVVSILFIIGSVLGGVVGYEIASAKWMGDAVAHHAGHFDAKGDFRWDS